MASPFDNKYAAIRDRIYYYADMYGIPRNIAIWQLWQENKFRNTGCSGAGACGIAQFIAATARRFGVNRYDVESSLNGWGKYMAWLLRQPYINGDIRLALGGYNAGEGRIQQYRGLPPFKETQHYVAYITRMAAQSGGNYSASGNSTIQPAPATQTPTPIPLVEYAPAPVSAPASNVTFVESGNANYLTYALIGLAGIVFVSYIQE